MNRRTLKKHCRRAVTILCERHGYSPDQFFASDGEESVYAPAGMERRYTTGRYRSANDRGFLDPGPLAGTPMLWERTSYEYDEWDCRLPSEALREIEFWERFEPTPEELAELQS